MPIADLRLSIKLEVVGPYDEKKCTAPVIAVLDEGQLYSSTDGDYTSFDLAVMFKKIADIIDGKS